MDRIESPAGSAQVFFPGLTKSFRSTCSQTKQNETMEITRLMAELYETKIVERKSNVIGKQLKMSEMEFICVFGRWLVWVVNVVVLGSGDAISIRGHIVIIVAEWNVRLPFVTQSKMQRLWRSPLKLLTTSDEFVRISSLKWMWACESIA